MKRTNDHSPEEIEVLQRRAVRYYDWLAHIYDVCAGNWYYGRARRVAIEQLQLKDGDTVLNVPCGTGQNYSMFQEYLNQSGLIIGIDLSTGMLGKAINKTVANNWRNVLNVVGDATQITPNWIVEHIDRPVQADAVLCDLGLSGFPEWENTIDNLLSILKPNGRFVIMDWYIPKWTLRGAFMKWIGKGEVDRPLYQYLETKVANFSVNLTFCRGGVFVASGDQKELLP
ncbi:MAG: methyltransferase domain-containing protein [Aureliella sp.]